MTAKETVKDILARVKAVFDAPAADPAAPPAAPAAPAAPTGTVYTLQDGTQISIVQAGTIPAVGDIVSVSGQPAPAGDLTLQDGGIITVDATGTITNYTPAAPVTTDLPAAAATPPAPAPVAAPVQAQVTPAQMQDMLSKFAVGDVDARVANLEIVAKALMQSEFGWQIMEQQRLADTNAAIEVYKTTLKMHSDKAADQEKIIAKHEETIKGLFELVDLLVKEPSADPKTLTPAQKEKFEKINAKEARIERYAAGIKKLKEEKSK